MEKQNYVVSLVLIVLFSASGALAGKLAIQHNVKPAGKPSTAKMQKQLEHNAKAVIHTTKKDVKTSIKKFKAAEKRYKTAKRADEKVLQKMIKGKTSKIRKEGKRKKPGPPANCKQQKKHISQQVRGYTSPDENIQLQRKTSMAYASMAGRIFSKTSSHDQPNQWNSVG